MFRTTTNVTGTLAASVILARGEREDGTVEPVAGAGVGE